MLDPDVVLRADGGAGAATLPSGYIRGAAEVARRALGFARLAAHARPVLVNGTAGLLVVRDGQPVSVLGFVIRAGRIHEVHIVADRDRLRRLLGPLPYACADQGEMHVS